MKARSLQGRSGINFRKQKKQEFAISAPVDVDPKEFKAWLTKFCQDDLEPFLATSLLAVPQASQEATIRRMLASQAPTFKILRGFGALGNADQETKTVGICPATTGATYEDVRGTLAHEFVHYVIQGQRTIQVLDFTREGITEYIARKSAERLGWQACDQAYEIEVQSIGLLVPFINEELMSWYLSETPNDLHMFSRMLATLKEHGVDDEVANTAVGIWRRKSLEFIQQRLREIKIIKRVSALESLHVDLTLSRLTLNKQIDRVRNATAHLDRVTGFCQTVRYELPVAKDSQHRSNAEKLFIEIGLAMQGRPELDLKRLPDFYGKEVIPVLKYLVLAAPAPQEPTDLQAQSLSLADHISDADSLLKFIEKINEGFTTHFQALQAKEAEIKSQEQEFDEEQARIKQEVDVGHHEMDRLNSQQAELVKEIVTAMQANGVDIGTRQEKAGVPASIRRSTQQLLDQ